VVLRARRTDDDSPRNGSTLHPAKPAFVIICK
jgi:hypothetical protein